MKVSKYPLISADQITSADIFYIVDSNDSDSSLFSKSMTYSTFLEALNRDIKTVKFYKDIDYDKDKKELKISVELTDGKTKVLCVDLNDFDLYSVTDGLSNYNGNDNIFSIDWTKIYKKSELSDKLATKSLSDIIDNNTIKINDSSRLCCGIDTSTFQSKGDYLSATGLGYALSGEGEKVGVDMGKIAAKDHSHTNYQPLGSYLSANALDTLSSHWETAYARISSLNNDISDDLGPYAYVSSLSTTDINGYKEYTFTSALNESDGVISVNVDDSTIKIIDNKLSCIVKSKEYQAGTGLTLSNNTFNLSDDYVKTISYENVKSNLSNDGYCVIFKDWKYNS